MKTKSILTLFAVCAAFLYVSCNNKIEEDLYWTDAPTSADTLYMNPVFEPDLADPSVVRTIDENGKTWFYAYGTENTWAPGVHRVTPIVRSRNLTKWEYVGDAITTKADWASSKGIWAPCMVYRNGTYYLYYSASTWGDSNPGFGLMTSQYPYGPFKEEGKVLDSNSSGVRNSIDPCFIEIKPSRGAARGYLFWGSFEGIYCQEVNLSDMKTLIGTKIQIAGAGYPESIEGCYVFPKEINGTTYYYLFASSNSCCEGLDTKYNTSVARATSVTGPYYRRDGQPMLNNNQGGTVILSGDVDYGWVGPGHNSEIITDDEGNDFIMYHAIDVRQTLLSGGATRRPLMLDRVYWDEEGWPSIGTNGKPSKTQQRAPVFHDVQ